MWENHFWWDTSRSQKLNPLRTQNQKIMFNNLPAPIIMRPNEKVTKKRVSFCTKVRCRSALHLNDYTDEEIQASWLNQDDMVRIRQDRRCTLEIIRNGGEWDDSKYCRRGLEYATPEASLARKELRRAARDKVLQEQALQLRATRSLDMELLAEAYNEYSHNARVSAYVVGLSDMKIAMDLNPLLLSTLVEGTDSVLKAEGAYDRTPFNSPSSRRYAKRMIVSVAA